MVILYGNFINQSKVELRSFSDAISIPAGLHGTDFLSEMVSNDYRITLIAPTGEVLYDNRADISEMENHLNREEVMEAFEVGRLQRIPCRPVLQEIFDGKFIELKNGMLRYKQ